MAKYNTLGLATIAFIERTLKIPTGEFQGEPFKLQEFQKKFILEVVDNPHDTRWAILSVGRKAGKTSLIAALVIATMIGPLRRGRKNLNIYSAAMSRDQAALVYNQVAAIINQSPLLSGMTRLAYHQKRISSRDPNYNIQYQALSSDVKTKFGLIPTMVIFDELGQELSEKNPLFEAIRSSGVSDRHFCQYIISTQAPNDDALLSKLIDNNRDNARAVVHVYGAPDDLEDEEALTLETFKKYHIGAGWNIRDEEILDEIHYASQSQINLVNYKNLYLNMRIDTRASAFDARDIAKCVLPNKEVEIPDGVPVYLGLDPSVSGDLTALVATFIGPNDKPTIMPFIWAPNYRIEQREKDEKLPYRKMADLGHITLTEGKSIDFSHVAAIIKELFDKHNVIQLRFDSYYFSAIKSHLIGCLLYTSPSPRD